MADKGRTIKVKVTMNPNPWYAKRSPTRESKNPGPRREEKSRTEPKLGAFFGSNRITRSCSIKREAGQSQFTLRLNLVIGLLTKLISWVFGLLFQSFVPNI